MNQVIITLKSNLSSEETDKLMEKMLWDSEFSYDFEDADWEINNQDSDLTYEALMQWDKNDLAEYILTLKK